MNPYVLGGIGIAFAVCLGALGVQSYRLQGVRGTLSVLQTQVKARDTADAKQALVNQRNKERTDEEYIAARRRAALARVSVKPAAEPIVAATGSGDDATACFDRGRLNNELTGFFGRVAERLSAIAESGEEVAAAYRACRAWALEAGGRSAAPAPGVASPPDHDATPKEPQAYAPLPGVSSAVLSRARDEAQQVAPGQQ